MVVVGRLIVIEGLDNSGKTTLAKNVRDRLGDDKCYLQPFPDRTTKLGKTIDKYLQSKKETITPEEIHDLFAANRSEVMLSLKKKLNDGVDVICDRYAYSGVAYSMAQGLDKDWCKKADARLPKPDLIVYLDISVDDAAKRAKSSGKPKEKYENKETQVKVMEAFTHHMMSEIRDWSFLDAMDSIETNVLKVLDMLQNCKGRINEDIKVWD